MKSRQITESIKIEITDATPVVHAVNFSIGHTPYAVVFEVKANDKAVRDEIHSRWVMPAINSMKDTDSITIGDYRIICEVRGTERTVYANDQVISKRKVSIY